MSSVYPEAPYAHELAQYEYDSAKAKGLDAVSLGLYWRDFIRSHEEA